MKKNCYFSFLIVCIIFIVSCSPKTINRGNKIIEEDVRYDENYLESNINGINIREDEDITESAIKRGSIDYLLSSNQETIKNSNLGISLANALVTKTFNIEKKRNFDIDLMYNKYLMPNDYIVITEEKTNIYNSPMEERSVLGEAYLYEKIKVINELEGSLINEKNMNKWYSIAWTNENGELLYGFIPENVGLLRTFRFDKMYDSIIEFEKQLKNSRYGYVSNYKNINGAPPLINNKDRDKYGINAYQSAPLYYNLKDMKEMRYVPDGMMVFILDESSEYFKVKIMDYEGEYWIPKKYVSLENNLNVLSKAIVVDINNQNEGVFEKRGDRWTLVSYGLATTGVQGTYTFETPVGKFKVLEKKDRFYYLDDITKEIAGYAPYGIRFAQGAYIHGVPVEYIKSDGENIDPGHKEFLFTIGTVPRSHKCVRNYTSHAKYLYDWVDTNNTGVIVFK